MTRPSRLLCTTLCVLCGLRIARSGAEDGGLPSREALAEAKAHRSGSSSGRGHSRAAAGGGDTTDDGDDESGGRFLVKLCDGGSSAVTASAHEALLKVCASGGQERPGAR